MFLEIAYGLYFGKLNYILNKLEEFIFLKNFIMSFSIVFYKFLIYFNYKFRFLYIRFI